MSKALGVLARLQRTRIDEIRAALADVLRAIDDLDGRVAALASEVLAEQRAAATDVAGLVLYSAIAPRMAARKTALDLQRAPLEGEEQRIRDLLAEAFIEQKKIEHLLDQADARRRRAENARDLAAMDEAAIMRAARKK
jgi:flagellar export protein FliJ